MNKLLAIEVFIAVAERGGFSAALEHLPVSRAGISKYVADLETELGGQLFHRTTRKVSLTNAGKAYYEKCKEILAAVEEADCIVSGLTATPTGLLRINAPMSFGHRQMGPLVAEFQRRYPKISIELILSDRKVDMVEEAFDVTIRITQPKDSSLVARKIAPCRFMLAASRGYLKSHGWPNAPKDLTKHNCLTYTYGPRGKTWSFHEGDQVHQVTINGNFDSNNGDLLCATAEHGGGIVLLPTFILCDAARGGRLLPLLQQYIVEPAGIYAVFPSSRMLSTKVRLWVDFMVEQMGDLPQWDRQTGAAERNE